MTDNRIHVVFVSDRNYFYFVLIAVTSLLYYHRKGNLVIHLLHPDLTEQELEKLRSLQKGAPFEVATHRIDLDDFRIGFGASSPILWRLAIPEYITDVDKIIYLDCDLVFCDDVEKLWSIDLQGHILGAVGDRVGQKVTTPGIIPTKYFNSGVMVWDLKRMRQENAMEKWQQVFKSHNSKLPYPDQTLLNLVHCNDMLLLPQNWNLHNSIYRNPPVPGMYTVPETIASISNPCIVHFTGHHKPWIFWKFTHHVYANRFWFFALKAPVSKAFKLKIWLKRIFTGRLHEPRCRRPWDNSIVKKTWD